MSQARPKPWEVSTGTSGASVGLSTAGSVPSQPTVTEQTTQNIAQSSAPTLPEKPENLVSQGNSNGGPEMSTTDMTSSGLGSTGYGSGMYGSGMYGSGMYGGGMYGSGMYGSGLGMYGSGLGGMYGGMGGMYGGGMGGMYGNGMGGSMAQGTEATFQLIESFIGAIIGFAQMLESTYYATHSSFFTMMSVANQFTHLKDALGSLFGIYALRGWIKKMILRLRGAREGFSVEDFKAYTSQQQTSGSKNTKTPKKGNGISLKPLLFFLAAVFGMPYLLKKFVTIVAQQQRRRQGGNIGRNDGRGLLQSNGITDPKLATLDPKKLEFARAIYDFNPENEQMEMSLKHGDLVAILTKTAPDGKPSSWWRCRSRDGRIGFVPYNYLEVIRRSKNDDKVVGLVKADKDDKLKEIK